MTTPSPSTPPPLPDISPPDHVRVLGMREVVNRIYDHLFQLHEYVRRRSAIDDHKWGMLIATRAIADSALRQAVAASEAMNRRPDLPDVTITGTYNVMDLQAQLEGAIAKRELARRDSWSKWLKRSRHDHLVTFLIAAFCALLGAAAGVFFMR